MILTGIIQFCKLDVGICLVHLYKHVMKIITLIFMFTKTMAFYIVLRHDQIYSRVNNVKSCLDTHLRDPEASAELSLSQYCKQNTLFGARNQFLQSVDIVYFCYSDDDSDNMNKFIIQLLICVCCSVSNSRNY